MQSGHSHYLFPQEVHEALLILLQPSAAEEAVFNRPDCALRFFQALHRLRGHYVEMRQSDLCSFFKYSPESLGLYGCLYGPLPALYVLFSTPCYL